MQIVKEISPNEMIGEFLKAELHSSRFRGGSLRALTMLGLSERLIENPDYTDSEQNDLRQKTLGLCRGWPDTDLFTDFPPNTTWSRANILLDELKKLYRLKSSTDMIDTERLLGVTADRVMDGKIVENIENNLICKIRKKVEEQKVLPPIILVGTSLDSKMVLIEGHSRSVAYSTFEQLPNDIPAIVGLSERMANWAYF